MQLMPAAMPGRAGRRGLCLAAGSGLEQREGRALRIGDNGEAADAGDAMGGRWTVPPAFAAWAAVASTSSTPT